MKDYSLEGFETERLVFRKLKPSDFEDWLPLFEAKDSAGFLGMPVSLSNRELCDLWFEKTMTRYTLNTGFMNALVLKDTQTLVGQCGILEQTIQEKPYIEVGYSILPKYWKKGLATEAAIACRNEAFNRKLSDLIISHVNKDNYGSMKVAQNNGMKKIHEYSDEHNNIMTIYGITHEEWENLESV